MSIPPPEHPRPEHPRPQMVREPWLCLNGPWEFAIDFGDSGLEQGWVDRPLDRTILVPFCPESRLSGIEHTDFMPAVWYRRTVAIPPSWQGSRLLLHFQAVDDEATVWVNGRQVGRHHGGWTPFTVDITHAALAGQEATIVVRARDDHRADKPKGKQSNRYGNYNCLYTRTTGIWQTVWMEPVPMRAHLGRPRIWPDVAQACFNLQQPVAGDRHALSMRVTVHQGDEAVCVESWPIAHQLTPQCQLKLPADRLRLWSPEDPFLHDITIELLDEAGQVMDAIRSYAGMRSVSIQGQAVLLNGQPVFQRLVLDQGYYPDGIMTAPSDEALQADIRLGMEAGFNGARLHQKVFEERFLHHADRMGYLVWGEFGDWGVDRYDDTRPHPYSDMTAAWTAQWLEVLARDMSHPSIIGWCPLNETREPMRDHVLGLDDITQALYQATKLADPTRPVIDASGYSHRVADADIYDSHDYEQDPARLAANHQGMAHGIAFMNGKDRNWSIPWNGQPYFVSEFGGIWWNPHVKPGEASWGYGNRPTSLEEFHIRFEKLCEVLLDHPHMFGYCYTQLTDVYQEQNGIYGFDRSVKFDMNRIAAAQRKPAAIEQSSGKGSRRKLPRREEITA